MIKMRNNDSNKLTIITLTTLRHEFLRQIEMFFTKNIHPSDRYWPVKVTKFYIFDEVRSKLFACSILKRGLIWTIGKRK